MVIRWLSGAVLLHGVALFNATAPGQIVHSLGSYSDLTKKVAATRASSSGSVVFQFSEGPLGPGSAVTYDQINEKPILGGKFVGRPGQLLVFPDHNVKQINVSWDLIGSNVARSVGYPAKDCGYVAIVFEIDGKEVIASTADYPDGRIRGTYNSIAPPGSGSVVVTPLTDGKVNVRADVTVFYSIAGGKKESFQVSIAGHEIVCDNEALIRLRKAASGSNAQKPATATPEMIDFRRQQTSAFQEKRKAEIAEERKQRNETNETILSSFAPLAALGGDLGDSARKMKELIEKYTKKWDALYDVRLSAAPKLDDSWKKKETITAYFDFQASNDLSESLDLSALEERDWAKLLEGFLPMIKRMPGGDSLAQAFEAIVKDHRDSADVSEAQAKKARAEAASRWKGILSKDPA